MSSGVADGASISSPPLNLKISPSKPWDANEVTCGSLGERSVPIDASTFTVPRWMCGAKAT
jgi:hypothetical protein